MNEDDSLFERGDDEDDYRCTNCKGTDITGDSYPSMTGGGYDSFLKCTTCGSIESHNPFTGAPIIRIHNHHLTKGC